MGNGDQNPQKKYNLRLRKANNIVDNSKSTDVNFKCIGIDESNTNDVKEMVLGDVSYISGYPTNIFSFSGGQPSRFHQTQHPIHQMPDIGMQYNSYFYSSIWNIQRNTWGWLQYTSPTLIHTTDDTSIDEKCSVNGFSNSVQYCIFIIFFLFILCDGFANEKG